MTTGERPPPPTRPRPGMLLTGPARCLPDFLILGAQKAGTSSLFAYLDRHPGVWMAPGKECNFFSGRWRPAVYYRGYFPLARTRRRLERELGGPLLLGEATPYYLFHPAVPARVARALPRAKLLVLLRDPVERAYSHYRHAVRFGQETLSFEEALDAEGERTEHETERLARSPFAVSDAHRHHSYAARGRYAEQLRRWFDQVGREAVHVEFAEHLFDDPRATLERIERFLDLPPGPERPFEQRNRGIEIGAMPETTRARLRASFADPNRDLEALLGVEVPW